MRSIADIIEHASLYVPEDAESIRVDVVMADEDPPYFTGIGEESGGDYTVAFSDVDLTVDKFYRLVEIEHE